MSRIIEGRGPNSGVDFTDPRTRSRVVTGGTGNGGIVSKEDLKPAVEIRLADLEKDAEAIAAIFNQPEVIEHLAGIAPARTPRNIKKFRENIASYMPDMPGINEEQIRELGKKVVIATKDEIKEFYSKASSSELYVAVVKGKVVGTITLEKPSGAGMLWGMVSKLAVSNENRNKGVATKLLQFIDDRMFKTLGCKGAAAGIIRGIEGDGIPLHIFEKEGYGGVGTLKDICLGWSNKEGKFLYRNSLRVQR